MVSERRVGYATQQLGRSLDLGRPRTKGDQVVVAQGSQAARWLVVEDRQSLPSCETFGAVTEPGGADVISEGFEEVVRHDRERGSGGERRPRLIIPTCAGEARPASLLRARAVHIEPFGRFVLSRIHATRSARVSTAPKLPLDNALSNTGDG